VKPDSWRRGVTPYQWLVLFVAWLGWVFDSMDSTIYAMVLDPALRNLLRSPGGGPVTAEAIGWYGGIIFSIFLIGWAIGGVLFGMFADRYGRAKTLVCTILIYALFTGLAAASQTWWQLALFRFITALGIGGEWAAGAALVAEVWPEDKRTRAAGVLQSAWAGGFFLAAILNLLLSDYGWRPMFVVGIAPAVVTVFIFLWIKEPERWVKARTAEQQTRLRPRRLAELFAPGMTRATLVGSGLAFVAVFGLWGATNWTPTLVRALPDLHDLSAPELTRHVSYAIILLNVGALVGYLSFGPLADRLGRRWVFALMCAGSLVMLPVTFLTPRTYTHVGVAAAAGLFQQWHIHRLSDLSAGIVSNSDSRDRRRLLFQRWPRSGCRGAVCHRLPGHGVRQFRPGRQCCGLDLPRWTSDSALCARNQRSTAPGINSANVDFWLN
jgi:MFS family permease